MAFGSAQIAKQQASDMARVMGQIGSERINKQQQADLARVNAPIQEGLQRYSSDLDRINRQQASDLARVSGVYDRLRVADLEGMQRIGATPEQVAQTYQPLLQQLLGRSTDAFGVPSLYSSVPPDQQQLLVSLLGG